MTTALVIVDIQNDYFPDGKLPLVGPIAAAQQAVRLLDHFRQTQRPIIHIQHIAVRPGATFFLPGTSGADFHPNVQPLPDEIIVQKNFPNSFRETPLLGVLREKQINRLIICGMQTNLCIDATTRGSRLRLRVHRRGGAGCSLRFSQVQFSPMPISVAQ